jgi:hypothetical protein
MRTWPLALLVAIALPRCKGSPDETPWCSLARPPVALAAGVARTWWRDAKPIVDARCGRCHAAQGIAPFTLARPSDFASRIGEVRRSIEDGTMPPYLASPCCTPYQLGIGLAPAERATLLDWLAQGAPEGDPSDAPDASTPRAGGLSRTDVSLRMPEEYLPAPPPGSTDDNRCFVMNWPLDRGGYITGLDVAPGARAVVHHLVVGALTGDDAAVAEQRDREDPLPGFSCNGGFGGVRNVTLLGGSLLGGDFPSGLGHRIEPGARILLNIHYSTAHHGAVFDRTEVRFKVDSAARGFEAVSVVNPAWLVADAMRVPAGEADATFFYQFRPTVSTGGQRVWLWNVTAHMHEFATRQRVMIVRADGRRECLLEIPRWRFGWEQPYWFATPKVLEPDDELYIECHFDNTAANQPVRGATPRDIAWGGNNQDMCAAFVAFAREAP